MLAGITIHLFLTLKPLIMKEVSTFKDLMVTQLQSLYEAENIWSDALRQNATVISNKELKRVFEDASKTSAEHASKVRKVLSDIGKPTTGKTNAIAADLAREIREITDSVADPQVLDAGLIVNHQCMNHYMIAKYGTVSSYARLLSEDNIASVLHDIMEEEKEEDKELTKLAEKKINVKAKEVAIH